MFLDAPREGHMGYSHGMMVQYINDLRCAPRGAHGLQSSILRMRWRTFVMRPARGAWVTVPKSENVGTAEKDAPREGRMGYSFTNEGRKILTA